MARLVCLDLGRAGYERALELQHRLVRDVLSSAEEQAFLVLVEHDPPVITLGRRSRREHLLASPRELRAAGVQLFEAARGGDVTYHGPGQLVAYPILRLDLHGRDVRRHVRRLEEVVIRAAGRLGVRAGREKGLTGVWASGEKLAAIGGAVRRWVTWHGLAVNVCPDLKHFDLIVPCGIRGRTATSLERILGRAGSVEQVKPVLVESIVQEFGFQGADWQRE